MDCCSCEADESREFSGPVIKRECTDVLCLVFLIIFICGMGGVAYHGYQNSGDPYKLVYGTDSFGNTCNRQNTPIPHAKYSGQNFIGYKKKFYLNFLALLARTKPRPSSLCVKRCPTPDKTIRTVKDLQEYANNSGLKLCRYDLRVDEYFNDVSGQVCPTLMSTKLTSLSFGIEKHKSILSRCVPVTFLDLAKSKSRNISSRFLSTVLTCENNEDDAISQLISDVEATWHIILSLSCLALVVTLMIMILMRFFAPVIIWMLVLCSALGSVALTALVWWEWYKCKHSRDASKNGKADSWRYMAYVATFSCIILLLILLIMRKRIRVVVQLFREASRAVADMPLLILQPCWTFFWLMLMVAIMTSVYTFIGTAGIYQVNNSTSKVTKKQIPGAIFFKAYYLFGFLWIVQIVLACHNMVIAGAVSTWYFSTTKGKMMAPILASVIRLVCYHMGSVAFGALIIAVLQFLRIILAYISEKLKGRTGDLVDFFVKCLASCLWLFEKVIKYINKNAYIMIAIYGYNFCTGSRRAFLLLFSNALNVLAINSIGTFLLFLAKLGVAAVPVLLGIEALEDKPGVCYTAVPLVTLGIISLIIGHVFLSVYGMAIDTIFLCFCEDLERNDGITKPYSMSKGLMECITKTSGSLEAAKKPRVVKVAGNENKAAIIATTTGAAT